MWERGARHNPVSARNRFYLDHRPILPQDPTMSYFRRAFSNYQIIYFPFIVGGKAVKYILSNNIPVKDREAIKELAAYQQHMVGIMSKVAIVPTIFLSGIFFSLYRPKMTGLSLLIVYGFYNLSSRFARGLIDKRYNDSMSYYYYKYQSLGVENLHDIEDPRRKFFKLDTTSYYRETAAEILHKQHHAGGHGHHDTSTYYGPHPVN